MKYQNLGFVYAIEPALKRVFSGEKLKEAFLRHIEIFNTQPYMASFVIGNVIGMEEKNVEPQKIVEIKQSLACAYAAIGDRIFWARLRISVYLLTLILCFFALLSEKIENNYAIFLSLIIPTILYATFSIYIRFVGIKKGYSCAGSGVCGLDFIDWNKIVRISSRINYLLMLSILVPAAFYFLRYRSRFLSDKIFAGEVAFVAFCVAIQRYFKEKKKPLTYSLASCLVAAMFFAILKEFFLR